MLVSKLLREDFLFQNAFDPADAYMVPKQSYQILKTILTVHYAALPLIEGDAEFEFKNLEACSFYGDIASAKEVKVENLEQLEVLQKRIMDEIGSLKK